MNFWMLKVAFIHALKYMVFCISNLDIKWLSKEDLNKVEMSENIKEQALLAFHFYNKKFR
ncbi:hypothetical protein GW923_04805 [Candidatus Pacearchaeota archaeon]|nr:hypothetical protein [Candidatus Pacearchaeota archaeon]